MPCRTKGSFIIINCHSLHQLTDLFPIHTCIIYKKCSSAHRNVHFQSIESQNPNLQLCMQPETNPSYPPPLNIFARLLTVEEKVEWTELDYYLYRRWSKRREKCWTENNHRHQSSSRNGSGVDVPRVGAYASISKTWRVMTASISISSRQRTQI